MLRLRALAPYRFPASLRSFRFALEPCTCTQTHETGESSVSRRPIRFGGPSGLARGVLLPRTSGRTEPLTPLSPPHSPSLRFRTSGASWGRLDCGTKPLREDRGPLLQSEVPSIDRGHLRTCASRRRSRARSRDGFPLRSGPRRPFIRRCRAALLALACYLRARLPSPHAHPIG